jgi:hypothetical protein
MFLGLPDPDPLVRCMDSDPNPSIIKQKSKKNLDTGTITKVCTTGNQRKIKKPNNFQDKEVPVQLFSFASYIT